MTATRGLLLAGVAALISGVSVFVNSYGVKAFGSATVYTTAKNSIAAVFLVVLTAGLVSAGSRRALTMPTDRRQWAWLAMIGMLGGGVAFVLFFNGLAHATSGPVQAQFLNKTLVIWVAVLAVPLLGERLGWLQFAAIGLLIVGQVVLSGGVSGLSRLSFGSGEVMILAATVLWAVELIIAKRLLRTLSSWTVALARMVLGSVLLIGWVLVRGDGALLVDMTGRQWGWVLLTGGLLTAYVTTWLAALALAPAVTVTAILVLAVPVTALLQALAGKATLAGQLDGLVLILLGCALAGAANLLGPDREPAAVAGQ